MNKKRKAYALFTLIATMFAIISASLITVFAILRTHNNNNYPTFKHEQYKDCSLSKEFDEQEGPQLYEAEELTLSEHIQIEGNIYASNKEAVSNFIKNETITLEVNSSSSVMVMFSLATSYVSENGRSVDASTLFSLTFNNNVNSLENAIIEANFNQYDFSENDLVPLHLYPGKNTITLTSLGDYLKVDYLALRGNNSNVSLSAIGPQKHKYLENESRQYYTSYLSQLNGPAIMMDESAKEKHAAFFSNPYDSLTFYISSEVDKESDVGLVIRLARENVQPNFEIYLNNTLVTLEELELSSSYQEFDLGKLTLVKGDNTLSLKNINGSFYFDCFILNRDINHSPNKLNERFEAEKANLTHGGQISSNTKASNYYVVSNNVIDSYVEFEIDTLVADEVHLAVDMSYVGHSQRSDFVFELSLNKTVLNTSDYMILNTGGYSSYQNFYLGKIHLITGKNILRIFSFTGNYNLDYIDLFHDSKDEIEAEDSILDKGNYVEQLHHASDNHAVLNNIINSTLTMNIYSPNSKKISLAMVYSYVGETADVSSFFSLSNNTATISLSDIYVVSTSRVSKFMNVKLCDITLEEGLNQLVVTNKKAGLNIDKFIIS